MKHIRPQSRPAIASFDWTIHSACSVAICYHLQFRDGVLGILTTGEDGGFQPLFKGKG